MIIRQNIRRNLTCIEGCNVKIKFTEKKNGSKFLSTWNNEGEKHDPEKCPYHINYKDVIGRRELIEKEEMTKFTEQQIEDSLKGKINRLLIKFSKDDIPKEKTSTNRVVNTGSDVEKTIKDDESGERSNTPSKARINYLEAETINGSYHKHRRGVIGKADNVQFGVADGNFWGYINLKNDYNRTNVYFPEAYYEGDNYKANKLEKILEILKSECERNLNNIIIACYGEIKLKDKSKNDFNINIINPRHIIINGMTMNEIYNIRKIKSLEKEV